MTEAIVTAELFLTHFPKLLYISKENSTVLYSKSFDDSVSYDPALVACSLNGLSLFLKNTFKKNHIGIVTLDDLGMKNITIDNITFTYLYEGQELEICPLQDLAHRLIATEAWDYIQQTECQIADRILDEIDLVVTQLFG